MQLHIWHVGNKFSFSFELFEEDREVKKFLSIIVEEERRAQ